MLPLLLLLSDSSNLGNGSPSASAKRFDYETRRRRSSSTTELRPRCFSSPADEARRNAIAAWSPWIPWASTSPASDALGFPLARVSSSAAVPRVESPFSVESGGKASWIAGSFESNRRLKKKVLSKHGGWFDYGSKKVFFLSLENKNGIEEIEWCEKIRALRSQAVNINGNFPFLSCFFWFTFSFI